MILYRTQQQLYNECKLMDKTLNNRQPNRSLALDSQKMNQ